MDIGAIVVVATLSLLAKGRMLRFVPMHANRSAIRVHGVAIFMEIRRRK